MFASLLSGWIQPESALPAYGSDRHLAQTRRCATRAGPPLRGHLAVVAGVIPASWRVKHPGVLRDGREGLLPCSPPIVLRSREMRLRPQLFAQETEVHARFCVIPPYVFNVLLQAGRSGGGPTQQPSTQRPVGTSIYLPVLLSGPAVAWGHLWALAGC